MDTSKGTLLRLFSATILIVASLFLSACDNDSDFGIDGEEGVNRSEYNPRKAFSETRNVLIFYEAGFNSLCKYLDADMNSELTLGYFPTKHRNDNVVLVYSKIAKDTKYAPVESYLRRIYDDGTGKVVSDTLMTLGTDEMASSSATMQKVLEYVKDNFPAKGYGMICSSHGSGWLPQGYYYSPSTYESKYRSGAVLQSGKKNARSSMTWLDDIPQDNLEDDPYYGMCRSITQEFAGEGFDGLRELTVTELADAIPMHLDYLLFDMCYTGGVEILYGFKDKADYLGMSPAEVLADGMFDYSQITTYLLKGSEPDLKGLFEDSFNRYDSKTGDWRSSTVTLASTEGAEELAKVCKTLNEKYRSELSTLKYSLVQGFYRNSRHYFFDLKDTYEKCGADDDELDELQKAIDACIVYKAATPSFLEFDITTDCGFTTYIPSSGTTLLNTNYKLEPWNQASEMVK